MTNRYKDEIERIGVNIAQKLKNGRIELRKLPEGRLRIVKKGHYYSYQLHLIKDGKRIRRGIAANPRLIAQLARKEYLLEENRRLEEDLTQIRKTFRLLNGTEPEKILKTMPSHYENISSGLLVGRSGIAVNPVEDPSMPPKQVTLRITDMSPAEWGAMPYRAKTKNLEDKTVLTSIGFWVRSRGESGITEIYADMLTPIHYDELLVINGYDISPDFIAIRPDGKLIFHEHCGRLQDKRYMEHHFWKLRQYRQAGITEWDNLIVTYDSPDGGIDMKLIRAQIESKFY